MPLRAGSYAGCHANPAARPPRPVHRQRLRDAGRAGPPGSTWTSTASSRPRTSPSASPACRWPRVVSSPLDRCRQTAGPAAGGPPPRRRCGSTSGSASALRRLDRPRRCRARQGAAVEDGAGAARRPRSSPGGEGDPCASSARAVNAVREWDAEIEAEHGADAVWLACSHGDVIKAIVADALGMHLDHVPADLGRPLLGHRHPLHPDRALRAARSTTPASCGSCVRRARASAEGVQPRAPRRSGRRGDGARRRSPVTRA